MGGASPALALAGEQPDAHGVAANGRRQHLIEEGCDKSQLECAAERQFGAASLRNPPPAQRQ